MKKILNVLLMAGTLITLLTACEYAFIEPTPAPPPPPVGDTISFAQDIIPLFNQSCNATCHKTGAIKPDLSASNAYTVLTTTKSTTNVDYVIAEQPLNSFLYNYCKPGANMATYTSAVQLDLIYRWIYAGALNN